jgi:hypothetical protein
MQRSPRLLEIADEVLRRFENPEGMPVNATITAGPQPFTGQEFSYGFDARNTQLPQGPQQQPQNDLAKAGLLSKSLDGLSPDQLQKLKFTLQEALMTMRAMTLVANGILFAINPRTRLVAVGVTFGAAAAMEWSIDQVILEIDKRLSQK